MSIFDKVLFSGLNWNMNVLTTDKPEEVFDPGFNVNSNNMLFFPRNYSSGGKVCHTISDPFLYAKGDTLYMLFEKQAGGDHGQISMVETTDLIHWKETAILKEPFHLSFPFIFEHQGKTYLLPETYYSSEIMLYEFERFPDKLKKVKTLLTGKFADSVLYLQDGLWFLFTMSEAHEQHLYTSSDLFGAWTLHPQSPICSDQRYSRNAGAIVQLNGRLFRVAQDGSHYYGEKLHLMEIIQLTESAYSERLEQENLFPGRYSWNSLGTHHLSLIEYKNKQVVALDGLINKRLTPRLAAWLKKVCFHFR
jgi:hypothetical protein